MNLQRARRSMEPRNKTQQWTLLLTGLGLLAISLAFVVTVSWVERYLGSNGSAPREIVQRIGLARWGLLVVGVGLLVTASAMARRARAWTLAVVVSLASCIGFIHARYPQHLLFKPERLARAILGLDVALRDYAPKSMLRVPPHEITRARYPAINIHAHFESSIHRSAEEMVRIMDATNVQLTVDLDGTLGKRLEQHLAKFHDLAPERLLIFAHVWFDHRLTDWNKFARQVASLEQAKADGARGIKIWKNLGLVTRDETGALIPLDDRRLEALWETAGRLNLPILIHVADPAAFFEPVDAHNERYEELTYLSPGWSFADPKYPRLAQLLNQFEHVVERHRGTIFIAAHLMNLAEDLDALGAVLDRHPNLYVDISARANELGRQPVSARAFLIRYADRVLFGTDGNPDEQLYRGYFKLLETSDEYFDYPRKPGYTQGRWQAYGLDLPEEVLRKIYHDNAARLLGLEPVKDRRGK